MRQASPVGGLVVIDGREYVVEQYTSPAEFARKYKNVTSMRGPEHTWLLKGARGADYVLTRRAGKGRREPFKFMSMGSARGWTTIDPPRVKFRRTAAPRVPRQQRKAPREVAGAMLLDDRFPKPPGTKCLEPQRFDGPGSISCYVVKPKKFIRIFGLDTNVVPRLYTPGYKGLVYDKTFKIGDTATYDSYNFVYLGTIVGIGQKTVTIQPDRSSGRKRRLKIPEFIWRHRRFDLEQIRARNLKTSYEI